MNAEFRFPRPWSEQTRMPESPPRVDRLYRWASGARCSGHESHVGPHLMIVSPHQDDFQGLNPDPSNGMPYVMHLPNRTDLYLVMPIQHWDE
jgi:hypothetical protein